MRQYTSNVSQNLFDVALMQYGSLEGLDKLVTDNSDLVQEDGQVNQKSTLFNIQNAPVNIRYQERLLILIPTTEAPGSPEYLQLQTGQFVLYQSGDKIKTK